MRLLHFIASWAEPICVPHVEEVDRAAAILGAEVVECDVDEVPELAARYSVMNVPALAVDGMASTLLVGAHSAERIVTHFRAVASA